MCCSRGAAAVTGSGDGLDDITGRGSWAANSGHAARPCRPPPQPARLHGGTPAGVTASCQDDKLVAGALRLRRGLRADSVRQPVGTGPIPLAARQYWARHAAPLGTHHPSHDCRRRRRRCTAAPSDGPDADGTDVLGSPWQRTKAKEAAAVVDASATEAAAVEDSLALGAPTVQARNKLIPINPGCARALLRWRRPGIYRKGVSLPHRFEPD